MKQHVRSVAASLAGRMGVAHDAALVERMLLAPQLEERVAAAEELAARASAADVEQRRKRLPASLPVGGIITPV